MKATAKPKTKLPDILYQKVAVRQKKKNEEIYPADPRSAVNGAQ